MTDEQTAAVRAASGSLTSAAMFLDHGREGSGIGNIRWAREKLETAGLLDHCSDAVTMIAAAIRSYEQGNDRSAAAQAVTAAERLDQRLAAA